MLTTSSLRIWSIRSPWMLAAGGLYCTRISTLRSFSALPAFMIQGTPSHLRAKPSLSHELSFHPKLIGSTLHWLYAFPAFLQDTPSACPPCQRRCNP